MARGNDCAQSAEQGAGNPGRPTDNFPIRPQSYHQSYHRLYHAERKEIVSRKKPRKSLTHKALGIGATGDGHFLTTQRGRACFGSPWRNVLTSQQIRSWHSARPMLEREVARGACYSRNLLPRGSIYRSRRVKMTGQQHSSLLQPPLRPRNGHTLRVLLPGRVSDPPTWPVVAALLGRLVEFLEAQRLPTGAFLRARPLTHVVVPRWRLHDRPWNHRRRPRTGRRVAADGPLPGSHGAR